MLVLGVCIGGFVLCHWVGGRAGVLGLTTAEEGRLSVGW